jgi:NAD-dependent deacetylase
MWYKGGGIACPSGKDHCIIALAISLQKSTNRMQSNLAKAADILRKSIHTTAFTGAGISVESGIPPFRGAEGLWSKYDPMVLEIEWFKEHPRESWEAIRDIFYAFYGKAEPNAAHRALVKLEQQGILKAIITQNIDNLHQEAGNSNVYEYHGSYHNIICTKCGSITKVAGLPLDELPPRCVHDGAVLKPDFVFFGEGIPQKASVASFNEVSVADVILIIGTTGEVMPASMIPRMAKMNGATIVEINTDTSSYTKDITDIFLQGRAGEVLPDLLQQINR